MTISFRALLILAAMALLGAAVPAHAAGNPEDQSSLNDGYSTFYHFCDQESKLGLLFWIKTAPPKIADYARRISATAKDDMATLKQFGAADPAMRLNKVSLPSFERSVRESMDTDRNQQLLWGSSGAGFTQAVCLTQSEATNYGLHVAKILAATDPDPNRARAMKRIFDKWTALHAEAYSLDR
jgi:hypothetical protein